MRPCKTFVVAQQGIEVVRFRFEKAEVTDFGWDLLREEVSRPVMTERKHGGQPIGRLRGQLSSCMERPC